jgi:hypothetical protein
MEYWLPFFEIAKNLVEIIAIFAGGAWALYRFGLLRENKAAIEIELHCKCIPEPNGRYFSYFDVTLINKGKVKAEARKKRRPAYRDEAETLKYGCSLLLRAIPKNIQERKPIGWFDEEAKTKSPIEGDIEVDLLYDYELNGETIFWMEPEESYHVGTGIVLQHGSYLAMITFVGNKENDDEFWRRTFIVQIPNQNSDSTI